MCVCCSPWYFGRGKSKKGTMKGVTITDTEFSYITWDYFLWKVGVARNVVVMIRQGLRQEVIHSESCGLVSKDVTNAVLEKVIFDVGVYLPV